MGDLNLQDYKLLLVDDDAAYTEGKSIRLESKGFNINAINNPEEAIEYLKANMVDVILLDYFMPQMTGKDFLNKLREFDKETLVILQTGYSGEKPQEEMFNELNIQGYYDKTQSFENLMLMVLSAIKSVKLLKEIKHREEEKQIKKLKDKFFADKINTMAGEISGKLMSIGGSAMVIETLVEDTSNSEQKELLLKRIEYLKDAASQIEDAVKALNIVSETETTPKNMLEKVKSLLWLGMHCKGTKLEIDSSDDFIIINVEEGAIPYLICKDIENRANSGSKDIRVIAHKEDDKVVIKITAETSMSEAEKQELIKVTDFCNDAHIEIGETSTTLVIEKVKK